MRITALGSGDAFCSAGRGHTSWLVDDAQGTFAVDFGATALLALQRLGRDPDAIAAIHFTHLHGDHTGGWPFFLVDAVYRSQRKDALLASGPPGTGARQLTGDVGYTSRTHPTASQRNFAGVSGQLN